MSAAILRDLNRAKAVFQTRATIAAMGIDPDSVRIATDGNSVSASIDTESDPGSYADALASPSCFITVLSEPSPHPSGAATLPGGADYDASRLFPNVRPPIWAGVRSFHEPDNA